jgi:cysteine desulfurase
VIKRFIYLDHAAATPVDRRVFDVMLPYFSGLFYNPSSPYLPAVRVRRDYDEAKRTLANLIGGKQDEIIITAGATESINLVFNSVSGHVIVPNIEHHAVLNCAKKCEHTIVPADGRGIVQPEVISAAITPNTQLISVALANNELGTIQPVRDIAEIVRKERMDRLKSGSKIPIYLHVDASQGVGQLNVNVARLGADLLTLNSGKIYGPKQVGLLWAASFVKLSPQIIGGGQERGIRSGTENVAGVIGFAKALELAVDHQSFEQKRLSTLRDYMQDSLLKVFPDAVISGSQKNRLAGHLHISFPGIDGERLLFILEDRGILLATGSACAANKGTKSHVLAAIGVSDEIANGSIRITLGRLSNEKDIRQSCKIIISELKKEYERLKK